MPIDVQNQKLTIKSGNAFLRQPFPWLFFCLMDFGKVYKLIFAFVKLNSEKKPNTMQVDQDLWYCSVASFFTAKEAIVMSHINKEWYALLKSQYLRINVLLQEILQPNLCFSVAIKLWPYYLEGLHKEKSIEKLKPLLYALDEASLVNLAISNGAIAIIIIQDKQLIKKLGQYNLACLQSTEQNHVNSLAPEKNLAAYAESKAYFRGEKLFCVLEKWHANPLIRLEIIYQNLINYLAPDLQKKLNNLCEFTQPELPAEDLSSWHFGL